MKTKKTMTLLDPISGLMECPICGSRHYAQIRPGSNGNYYRACWRCANGCRLPKKDSSLKNYYI